MNTKKKQKEKKKKTRKRKTPTQKITDQLQDIDEEQIKSEFEQLRKLNCIPVSQNIRLGNAIVNYFTLEERLHTKGNQHMDFYTFWKKRNTYRNVPHIRKMLHFYKSRHIDLIRKYKYIYNLYFSSIAIFRPIVAMKLYCYVNAKHILDFTMGWGGRLVGACALDIPSYIGIDMNVHLEEPYKKMTHFLKEQGTTTDIKLYFQDALKIDYTKLYYDTVFTSPPYYNVETYRSNNNYNTKEEWQEQFYVPLFSRIWKSLQRKGSFCLNVPEEIYQHSCVPFLGKCHTKFLLDKKDRSKKTKYKEYVYIWFKT